MKLPSAAARGIALLVFAASLSSAQVLMLDFGPTTAIDDAGPADSRINSPYHTANTLFTGTSWNKIGVADVGSGLSWSDGAPASGVSLDLGATTAPGATIGMGNVPSNGTTLTGSAMTTGVYADTSPGRDGIFTGASSGSERAVGLQIGGLAAGTYQVYITGRNTNTSAGQTQNYYAGVSSSSGDFTFTASGYQHTALTFFAAPTTQNNQWSVTSTPNYAVFSVTLTSGDFLNLAVKGGSSGEQRGFLNSVQIVSLSTIPEPSAAAAFAGALTLGCVLLRRRRAS